jgi:hypothetical protein
MLNQHSDKIAHLYADACCCNRPNNEPGGAGLRYSGSDSYNQDRKRTGHQHNDSEALRQQPPTDKLTIASQIIVYCSLAL